MDIVCISHLRWNFVYQRPQHLMSRLAKQFRVFYFEEPIFDTEVPYLEITFTREKLWSVTPHIPSDLPESDCVTYQQNLLAQLFQQFEIKDYICWFYTPMAMSITEKLPKASLIIYDCMDELSAFKNAPASITEKEQVLMSNADLVFTGGQSLYESKKALHKNIFAFPSSIDKEHFQKARLEGEDPEDQAMIPHPRIGFFGVIDERMNIELIDQLALSRPDWNIVLIGPVVKIDPATLPRHANIHYLGSKPYDLLPIYLRHWDVAILPFAINASTKFISPTKTPEYLAGGKPVVSTPVQDVVDPYGNQGLVYIGDTQEEFIKGIEWALEIRTDNKWLKAVDSFLEGISWDKTFERMMFQINTTLDKKKNDDLNTETIKKESAYV